MDLISMLSKLVFFTVLVLCCNVQVEGQSFPITKYGAKTNGDAAPALMSAFKDACASTSASEIIVPKGTFESGPVKFEGPCKAPMKFILQGNLKAPLKINTQGWITFYHVSYLTITGGGTLDGVGQEMWKKQPECLKHVTTCKSHSINLRIDFCNMTLIEGITSLNSKNFHINVLSSNNITFNQVTIIAPAESPNTDGIHIAKSKGVTVTNSNIGTGDDCISVGDGMEDLKITNVKCGPGHGISIGSLGLYQNEEPLRGILVQGCTLSNTDNGVRIKSWPDKYDCVATDIKFIDITMRNVTNPVIIEQAYCPYTSCKKVSSSNVKLENIVFKGISGTTPTATPITLNCMPGGCKNIQLGNINLKYTGSQGPARANCTNIKPSISGSVSPTGC